MRTLTVQTPSHQYPIFIGNHLIEQADVLLKPDVSNKVAIVTNDCALISRIFSDDLG